MLAAGQSVDSVLDTFRRADDGIHLRQVGIVDADGKSATFIGDGCHPWASSSACWIFTGCTWIGPLCLPID